MSLSATVSAPSVSQGLPTITAQGSSLATRPAQLDACGLHQPWSSSIVSGFQPSVPTGFLLSNSSTSTSPVAVATQANILTVMLSSLVVPSFVPAFSLATLSSIAPCSLAVYSLQATVNSALASQPIVGHMAVPLLTALPPQQPFVVSPGYSPVPFKVVSQMNAGKIVNVEDLLSENITIT